LHKVADAFFADAAVAATALSVAVMAEFGRDGIAEATASTTLSTAAETEEFRDEAVERELASAAPESNSKAAKNATAMVFPDTNITRSCISPPL
jgi:hypothetical protein